MLQRVTPIKRIILGANTALGGYSGHHVPVSKALATGQHKLQCVMHAKSTNSLNDDFRCHPLSGCMIQEINALLPLLQSLCVLRRCVSCSMLRLAYLVKSNRAGAREMWQSLASAVAGQGPRLSLLLLLDVCKLK